MKILLFGLLAMFLMPAAVAAGQESQPLGKIETNWPGIDYRITFVKRIPPGRLLVGVSLAATAAAPPGGTMIGFAGLKQWVQIRRSYSYMKYEHEKIR